MKSYNAVYKSSYLSKFNPFIEDKIIWMGGRLSYASIPYNSKFPILFYQLNLYLQNYCLNMNTLDCFMLVYNHCWLIFKTLIGPLLDVNWQVILTSMSQMFSHKPKEYCTVHSSITKPTCCHSMSFFSNWSGLLWTFINS